MSSVVSPITATPSNLPEKVHPTDDSILVAVLSQRQTANRRLLCGARFDAVAHLLSGKGETFFTCHQSGKTNNMFLSVIGRRYLEKKF